MPSAESEASHMEIHSNSQTSQYSFFNKTVVLRSNWGMVTEQPLICPSFPFNQDTSSGVQSNIVEQL